MFILTCTFYTLKYYFILSIWFTIYWYWYIC